MNSTRGQHQPLFPLVLTMHPYYTVLQMGNKLPQALLARNGLTFYSTMWELLILELVQGWTGRCPQFYQDAEVQFHSAAAGGQHCKSLCGYILPVVTDRTNSCWS